uniref:Uncharacterized protein n=1 Tax=Anopheles coluzzii TaxID=1518534 RepID=A0A8W7PPX1_ANOCL
MKLWHRKSVIPMPSISTHLRHSVACAREWIIRFHESDAHQRIAHPADVCIAWVVAVEFEPEIRIGERLSAEESYRKNQQSPKTMTNRRPKMTGQSSVHEASSLCCYVTEALLVAIIEVPGAYPVCASPGPVVEQSPCYRTL